MLFCQTSIEFFFKFSLLKIFNTFQVGVLQKNCTYASFCNIEGL